MAKTSPRVSGAEMDTMVRLFDSVGTELAIDDDYGPERYFSLNFTFEAPPGMYYLAVSGFANYQYDPNLEGSGIEGDIGDYRLDIFLTGAPPPPVPSTAGGLADVARASPRESSDPLPNQGLTSFREAPALLREEFQRRWSEQRVLDRFLALIESDRTVAVPKYSGRNELENFL